MTPAPKNFELEFARCHELNIKWWQDPVTGLPIKRNLGQLCMLAVSELAEALEGHRKSLRDDHLPLRPMAEVELADCIIRLFDLIGSKQFFTDVQIVGLDYVWGIHNFAESLLMVTYEIAMIDAHSGSANQHAALAIQYIGRIANHFKFDLWGAYEEKLVYNQQRADHKHENRIKEGGKKY